ncbi:hypothetical protein JVT61DRAFT_1862 [Boletus reticuloceps]|uniref:Uncharacterized protein n=1 Tax=Boletus reticuloceps TaxID=495285 RepID=A0A8I3ABR8_9AGAM|nr:hypothetical protein JVT61DRAFT_1862 [Boletus reticuloceps]
MNAQPSQPLGSVSDLDGSLLQNSAYVGITIQNILYGVELVLYFKTMRILLRNKEGLKKIDSFWGLFSTMMVILITVWVATSAIFGQKLWLMDFPGGPDAYWEKHISDWYLDWGTTAVILLQLMTDGLMIYRCRIIWNMYRAIVVPVILWLATLVLGVLVDWTSSSPGGNFFTGESAQLALAYYGVSVFLNTVLTCMICYRILQHGRKVRKHFGPEQASLFFGVVTLVIESVFPYTLSGIAFLVSLGVNSPTSAGLVDVYFLLMVRGVDSFFAGNVS